jgi:exopolyphosphatase/guanosine-5'-triphosphate,3'-diphosphate pyrophosphatase
MQHGRRNGRGDAPSETNAAAGPGAAGGNGADGNVYAALDLGTNNCRMLVAKPEGADFQVVDSFSRVTRLGEGLSRSGRLAPEAMDRTLEALKRCADKMHRRRVNVSRHVATEACRRAVNCDEFLARVERETGLALEIITAHEEATLALKGCSGLIDHGVPHALLFDIGGGSTEVLYVKVPGDGSVTVEGCISLPMGVVTVAEDCGGGDLCERTYNDVAGHAQRLLMPFEQVHRIDERIMARDIQMIGTSGTVTTLGGLALGLPRYDRATVDGITLDFATLLEKSRMLCRMSLQQRAAEPCIGWQRADLVLAGCAILEAICRLWPVGKLRVADRGLREGLLMDLIHPTRVRVMPGAGADLSMTAPARP